MNILVTGASRGIGFETVKILSKVNGVRILAISRNNEKLKLLSEFSPNIIPYAYDLTELKNNASAFYDEISKDFDHIDILINNAGYLFNSHFTEFPATEASKIFDINFFMPAQIIQTLLPLLKKSNQAHVVNISSMGGFQGTAKFPGLSFYSASKAAISSLTECLAEEFKETQVKFNCLALGAVQTEMLEEAFPGYQAPLSATEMAEHLSDFALNGHRFYNGKILPVALTTP